MAGYTYSFAAGYRDMYIVKLNSSGLIQWIRTVGGTDDDGAYSIIQTTDGGYVAAGWSTCLGRLSITTIVKTKLDTAGSFNGAESSTEQTMNMLLRLSKPQTADLQYGVSATGGAFTAELLSREA